MLFRSIFTAVIAFFALVPAIADDRPNFVIVLCDDLGYGDLPAYGHPHIKTPHLDALASEGILLTDCYSAAPVCSPSRVGLLTGRSPNRAGVYDWIPEARRPTPDRRDQVHMRITEVTIPRLLSDAGYQTCMAGKWHCNAAFNSADQPQPGDFGFQHWLATQNNAAPSHENPNNYVRNGEPIGKVDSFSCQYAVDEALRWLEGTEESQPFFLYVPFHEPHEPVASPPELVAQYRDVARTEDEAQYFANVANVDAAVGKLVAGLDRTNRRNNTLIIFTSDNGPETHNRYPNAKRSYGRPGVLRGMKLHTTDAGFRVAGIVNWKGGLAESMVGSVSKTPVSSLDFLPTFCQLANAELPADLNLDGTNFLPALQGEQVPREMPLVWAYFNALNESRVAMRKGDWKVLAKLNGGEFKKLQNVTTETFPMVRDAVLTDVEIYNVKEDIGESKNLAESKPELAERLGEELRSRYTELVTHSHVW